MIKFQKDEASALTDMLADQLTASFQFGVGYDEAVFEAHVAAHETLSVNQVRQTHLLVRAGF